MTVLGPAVSTTPSSNPPKLGIREIADGDIPLVTDLLTRGFPCPRQYWEVGLGRLRTRFAPSDMPRYGFLLEADGAPVGVILLISDIRWVNGRAELFANLSGWYVDPTYRSHATQLLRRALTNKQATFLSISAAIHVRPVYKALGFKCYASGQHVAILSLARNRRKTRTRIVGPAGFNMLALDDKERRRLNAQVHYGCYSFCCVTDDQIRPFVFLPRTIRRFIPCVQLVYCRDISDLSDVAGSVGRYLLSLGRPFVLIDADGPIRGLPGKYFNDATPKFYKGPIRPSLGDLTETEATIFGIYSPSATYR